MVSNWSFANLSWTLFDLRVKLAKDFNMRPECVGLKSKTSMIELSTAFNNQTLSQMQVMNGEAFEFFEVDIPETPEEKLVK